MRSIGLDRCRHNRKDLRRTSQCPRTQWAAAPCAPAARRAVRAAAADAATTTATPTLTKRMFDALDAKQQQPQVRG
jgi:hypothetical protein